MRTGLRRALSTCVLGLLAVCAQPTRAAMPLDVQNVDLVPLIDASAGNPTRFAVSVPHPVSLTTHGQWAESGGTSTWTYSTRIPTAISISFHALAAALPPSAVLSVTGARSSATYRARDVHRGGLWARPLLGDTLALAITVSTRERALLVLDIDSFQAGYRALGGAVADHPYYARMKAAAPANCSVNYSCQVTSANQGPARATIAIVVGNLLQCTGTLLNNTAADGAPYVLTARHCENGVIGGGNPDAAASVTVYWDAVSPCASALASIYDGAATTQGGATTVVEQQDAWLIRLDSAPAASDAYYAGWDATGGTFDGGYSIHHALGYAKQYVDWYGQAILLDVPGTTLKVGYASTFWGLVNQRGNVGAGASGGALFDPANHVVGSGSLAVLPAGANSAGVCPAASPSAPGPATIAAEYTSLAAAWISTADTTSTTGTATIGSTLDPAGTGARVLDGAGYTPVTLQLDAFTAQSGSAGTGTVVTLNWSAPQAQSCTATGGLAGDGWTGALPASGSLSLTEQAGGRISYGLRCAGTGTVGGASVAVNWNYVSPVVNINGPGQQYAANDPFQVQWASNTQPCTASGGSPGDGWPGAKSASGSATVTGSDLGTYTYTLTCGTGTRVASGQFTVTFVGPLVSAITTDATQLRVGQPANLQWTDRGGCTTSGGGPGDGWAGSTYHYGSPTRAVTETVPGTYTYTISCTGGGLTASSSISLTFTNAAPAVTLTPSAASVEIYTDAGAYATGIVNLDFTSNVRPCTLAYVGPGDVQGQINVLSGVFPTGTAMDSQAVAGTYVYTLSCGTGADQAQATATVNWYTNQPAVQLSLPDPLPQGFGMEFLWTSNVFPCTATGGTPGDGWGGPRNGPSGRQTVVESQAGAVTFGMTCGSGAQVVSTQVTTHVVAATATISASATTLQVGDVLLINWSSNFDGCTSSIAPGNGSWGNLLRGTGGFQTTQYVPGTYTYAVNCEGATASVQVTFGGVAPAATLQASPSSANVNTPVDLAWNSLSGSTCIASGGNAADSWSGSLPSAGFRSVTSTTATSVTYTVTCTYPGGVGQSQAQVQVVYSAIAATEPPTSVPTVTLTANAATATVGKAVSLAWSSTNASQCSVSGGAGGDGWTGIVATSGSMSVTEATAGSYTYVITCAGLPPSASAQVSITFSAAGGTTGGGGGSGGGGGGAFGPPALWMLSLAALWQLLGVRPGLKRPRLEPRG